MQRNRRKTSDIRVQWALRAGTLAGILLVLLSACAPQVVVVPAPVTWPSEVTTQEGVTFYVRGLRFPGTRQDLRVKEAGTWTWIPLSLIQQLELTGPVHDRYRSGQILLKSGGIIRGEVFVDHLVEGTTDLGYWNMPLIDVVRLKMGTE